MRRVVLAVGVLFTLACGGAPVPAPKDNLTACQAWVAHHNGLACIERDLDPARICASVARSPHDLVPYYTCLVAHAGCEGSRPDLDTASCRLPR